MPIPRFCNILTLSILAAATLSVPLARADVPKITTQIDWPSFMGREDMKWDHVPAKWEEAPFLGNGLMGCTVYLADDKQHLRFRIGRSDVVFKGDRLPIGDMVLQTAGEVTGANLRLSLWDATLSGDITTTKGTVHLNTYTHAHDMLQVITLKTDPGETAATWTWQPGLAVDPRIIHNKIAITDADKNPAPSQTTAGEDTVAIQTLASGGGHATAWRDITQKDGSRTLFLSVGYSPKEITDATKQATDVVDSSISTGLDKLTLSHQEWWHTYFPESFISLPDARMESFWWIQMYKLASATRADKQIIDLMGPWFRDTPWPRIWWNLNLQLTYWPIYTANRLELGLPLTNTISNRRALLAKNAGQYSADSYAVGRTTSYGLESTAHNEIGDLPWALHNFYLQYRYSMDDAMLRNQLYPLLKGSINFYLHQLKKGDDGKLHLPVGYSPEYPKQPEPNPDTNYDLSLLRWGCETLLSITDRLKINDPQMQQWKDTLANLTPYPTDANGLMISPAVPVTVSHRHYSHLLMVYPLHIMDPVENRELIDKTFNHWLADQSGFRGFSYTGAASIFALEGNGDDAFKYLNTWLDGNDLTGKPLRFPVQSNTMYVEAGPVIETPLSGAASINDMLLTSWGNTLRVFPAIPTAWKDVSFDKLRGEGAFIVSASRKDGVTQFVKIESLAGEPCRIVTDILNPKAIDAAGKPLTLKSVGTNTYELPLQKGQMAILIPLNGMPNLILAPTDTDHKNWNAWGGAKDQRRVE